MKNLFRVLALLAVCGIAVAQQSYVIFEPSPGANPFWGTNLANVVISNVTFHGKVTFINNSNSPSLWNTNGAGMYSPSDTTAHTMKFGSNTTIGASVVFSTVSGGRGNTIDASQTFVTIAGGDANRVRDDYGTVGGGLGNDVRNTGSTIAGGQNNLTDSGDMIAIAGGDQNTGRGDYAFLGGGQLNSMFANASGSDGVASTLVGGTRNSIGSSTFGASYAFIGGGRTNIVPDEGDYSVVVGGSLNTAGPGGGGAGKGNFVGGGFNNGVSSLGIDRVFIGGGEKNLVNADYSAVLAGVSNNVTATFAMAIGNFITNATTKSVEIGPDNASKTRFDVNGVTALKLITATNGFASYSSNLLAVTSVALTGNPALWTNTLTKNVQAVWSGGTVSGVGVNASLWPTPAGDGYVILQPGEWLAITNTGVPAFAWKPL